jgi:predicted GTPase
VGEERSIVSAMSGTTRDAVDTELSLPDGRRFTLIDTAGIRKRTAVASSDDGAEPLSVNRALQAIRWSARYCLWCKDVQLVSSDQPDCMLIGRHQLD